MKRLITISLLCMTMLLILTGCWGRREMSDLAIVGGLGIDEGTAHKFKVSLQVINPGGVAAKQSAGGANSPVYLYQGEGDTVFEAWRKLTNSMPRKGYFAHLQIMVIGEKLARKGIGDLLDVVSRMDEFRSDFYIVVSKASNAEDILKVFTGLEKVPGTKLLKTLETSQGAWAGTVKVSYDQLISDLMSPGKQPVLTGVYIKGDRTAGNNQSNAEQIDTPAKIVFGGIAAFREDKLVGWLNEHESKGYNYIRGEVKNTIGVISCPGGGKMGIEVKKSKVKIKGKVINGKPQIDVAIKNFGSIVDVECAVDLSKEETLKKLQKIANEKLTLIVEKSVHKAQKKWKSDIFGFGEAIYRADPQAWKDLEKDWDHIFSTELTVHIHGENEFPQTGSVYKTYLEKMKKVRGKGVMEEE